MNSRYFIGEHARGVGILLLIASLFSCRLRFFFFLVANGELAVLHQRACTRGGDSTAYFFPVFMSVAFLFFSSSQQ